MFEALKNLFSSDEAKLRDSVLTTQTVTVAVKSPVYHEIIPAHDGFTVRVYDRKTSVLLEETTEATISTAKRTALALVNKYNMEGE